MGLTKDPFTWFVITKHANVPLEEGERVEEGDIRARVNEVTQRAGGAYYLKNLNRRKPRIFIAGARADLGVCVTQVWRTP